MILKKSEIFSLIIRLNTEKLVVKRVVNSNIIDKLYKGEIRLIEEERSNNETIDVSMLSPNNRKKYEQAIEVVQFLF